MSVVIRQSVNFHVQIDVVIVDVSSQFVGRDCLHHVKRKTVFGGEFVQKETVVRLSCSVTASGVVTRVKRVLSSNRLGFVCVEFAVVIEGRKKCIVATLVEWSKVHARVYPNADVLDRSWKKSMAVNEVRSTRHVRQGDDMVTEDRQAQGQKRSSHL